MQLSTISDHAYVKPIAAKAWFDINNRQIPITTGFGTRKDGTINYPNILIVSVKFPVKVMRFLIPNDNKEFIKTVQIVKQLLSSNSIEKLLQYVSNLKADRYVRYSGSESWAEA